MKSKSLKANKLLCDNHHKTSLLAGKTLKFVVFGLFLLLTINVNMRGQSVDAFNPGVDRMVLAFAEQIDGKILIGGMFSGVNGQPHRYIARLNPDGTLDTA